MFLIAILGIVGFGNGIVQRSTIATWCLNVWLAPWMVIAIVAAILAAYDSSRNIVRLGIAGLCRPRQWFEMARASWILGMVALAISLSVARFTPPALWNFIYAGFGIAVCCWALFPFAATVGYVLRTGAGRRVMGRAQDCVEFFYPIFMSGLLVACSVFALGPFADPMVVIACLVTLCLAGAAVAATLNFGNRSRAPSPRR